MSQMYLKIGDLNLDFQGQIVIEIKKLCVSLECDNILIVLRTWISSKTGDLDLDLQG